MKPIAKVLLAVEVLVCFGPMTFILFLGLLIAPFQLTLLFTLEEEARLGSLLFLVAVAFGMAGLVALTNVLLWLFSPRASFLGPRWTLLGMLLGIVPVSVYAFGPVDSMSWRIAGVLPLVCSLHVAYLARRLFFQRKSWTT